MIVVREIREDAEGVGNETSLVKVTKVEFPTICLACLFCKDIVLFTLLFKKGFMKNVESVWF